MKVSIVAKIILCALFVLVPNSQSDAAKPDDGTIKFQILRNGNPFGMHMLNFQDLDDGTMAVDINIKMSVSLGPITMFRYEHENREVWKGDELISLKSQTNDNGDDYLVKASWNEDQVSVKNQDREFEAVPDVYTTSYWNDVSIKANQLLNTQKGQIENVTVENLGVDTIQTAVETLQAQHYKIISDSLDYPIHIWYDLNTSQWVGLKFKVRGSELYYKRLDKVEG